MPAGLLVLTFVVAGLAASGVECFRARRASRWSASAQVILPEEWFRITHRSADGRPLVEPDAIAEEILSGWRPDRSRSGDSSSKSGAAAADVPLAESQSESLRRRLEVTVERSSAGMVRINLSVSAKAKELAIQQANELAAAYAVRMRLAVAREVLRRAAEMGALEQRVEEQLRQVKPQLDGIVDRAVSRTAAYLPADDSQTAQEISQNAADSEASSPFVEESARTTGNSEGRADRAALQKQLDDLHRQRQRLLVERTSQHPDVRQIDTQIRQVESQLAALPSVERLGPRSAPKTSKPKPESTPMVRAPQASSSATIATPVAAPALTPPTAPPVGPSPNSARSVELFQAIQGLQERVESIARDLKHVREMKLPAAGSLMRGDDLGVQWADRAEMIAARVAWRAILLVGLAAGLVATAGLGMIGAGWAIDTPLATTRSIERDLAVPVIGEILVDRPLPENAANRELRARWKWPCILGGLAVLGAYFFFLVQPFFAG